MRSLRHICPLQCFSFSLFFHRARAAADAPRACSVWMHFSMCVWCFTEFMRIRFNRLQLLNALSSSFHLLNVNVYLWLSESRIRIDFYLCLCMKCSDLGSRFVFERTKSVQTSHQSDNARSNFQCRSDEKHRMEWNRARSSAIKVKENGTMAVVPCCRHRFSNRGRRIFFSSDW